MPRSIRLSPGIRSLLALGLGMAAIQPVPAANTLAPLETVRFEDFRVNAVAFRLMIASRDLCGAKAPASGLLLHSLRDYRKGRRLIGRMFALDQGPGILAVAPDSPAAAAGLMAGDILTAMTGQPAGTLHLMTTGEAMAAMERAMRAGPIRLGVRREGVPREMELVPVAGCDASVRLVGSQRRNAFADDREVRISTALLKLIDNDDELAFLMGHELAHIIARRRQPAEAGQGPASPAAAELEADKLGLTLAVRAGYDPIAAGGLWNRLAQALGAEAMTDRAHPTPEQRILATTRTASGLSDGQTAEAAFQR